VAEPVAAAAPQSSQFLSKRKRRRRNRDKRALASSLTAVAGDSVPTGHGPAAGGAAAPASEPVSAAVAGAGAASGRDMTTPGDEPVATVTWAPKMPPAAAPSVPWRKPAYAAAAAALVPSLVIDDSDPDSAERVLEERAEKHALRRSFLPPILLDREDRSTRQGGLTLAVIILLIAATLTLSYLMRRPSASGDGMTQLPAPASHIG
jgi:hypothetical protein